MMRVKRPEKLACFKILSLVSFESGDVRADSDDVMRIVSGSAKLFFLFSATKRSASSWSLLSVTMPR